MKHAVYSGSRNLYPEMAAAAKSLAANSDVDRIYLLIEDPEFPSDLPSYVEAIDVSGQGWFPDGGPNMNSEFTYLALIRAALCHLFPEIDRILSLDVDAFCVGDVSDVWDIPLDGFYLAASPEPVCCGKGLMYCNTGVALYNLDMLRDGKADEVIEVLTPGAASFALPARDLRDENGGAVEIAQVPGRVYSFLPDRPLRPGDILRLRADGCRRG